MARCSLVIKDYGGWALRNDSMSRMLRELDAAGALPKEFPPLCIQTGDRCIIKRTGESEDGVELHLWQSQPVDDELRARLPLCRVLSMCSTPKYADVAIPDWCFDAWPEAGVAQGQYDEACVSLALAGAAAPSSPQKISWAGTVHHHPSRMRLVEMAKAHPDRFAVNAVADRTLAEADGATTDATNQQQQQQQQQQHRTLIEQMGACWYLLDVQGKGYSSRLKLLLHSGRCVFYARRPWQEYYTAALTPWVHYVPVSEDLSDLIDRLDWDDANPKKVLAKAALAKAISDGTAADDAWRVGPSEVSSSAANGNGNGSNGHGGEEGELRRGDWASNRASYDAVRMYYRWTFMPVSKDRRRPLSLLASRGVTDLTDRDVYTFGVYTGASLKFWFGNFDAIGVTTGPHWGFDSFEGLPEETDGMELECKAWLPGSFSAADQFGVYTFGEQRRHLTRQRSLDVSGALPSPIASSTAAWGHAPPRAGLGGRPRSRTRCGRARWLRA